MENKNELPLKLYKKLALILKDGLSVGKSGHNNHFNYDYVTEADVVEAIRTAFAKHGIIYHFNMEEVLQVTESIVRAKVKFTIIDADSGEQLSSIVYGDGQSKDDKAVPKAITSSQKYFLMKSFMLATGDDPEKDTVSVKTSTTRSTFKSTTPKAGSVGISGVTAVEAVSNSGSVTGEVDASKPPTTTKTFSRTGFKRNTAANTTTTTTAETPTNSNEEVEF